MSVNIYIVIITLAVSYALGCLNAGFYLVKISGAGKDIRKEGSGNAGATNAGRIMGRWGFSLVAFWDGLKGLIAVWLTSYLLSNQTIKEYAEPEFYLFLGLSMFFCVLGHIYPLQLGFKGGRGVATACGGVFGISPLLFVIMLALFALVYLVSKKYHLSGIVCIIALPVASLIIGLPYTVSVCCILLALLMLCQFRSRISSLFSNKKV